MRNKMLENAPLVKLLVCLMAGLTAGKYILIELPLLPVFAGVVAVALLAWQYEYIQSAAIAACCLLLGMLLIQRQRQQGQTKWPDGEVCYEAVVMSRPAEKPRTMAVDVVLTGSGRKLKCYLYKDERSRRLDIGDGLRACSVIKADGTTFVRSWKWQKVRLSLEGLPRMDRTRLYFLKLRSRLLQRYLEQGLDGDQYAVVAAMALGDKSALTKGLKDTYSITGASHVLALSGLHLGIIYALLALLVPGRRWQIASSVLVVSAIWAFVFLAGMSVSVVRSAVMVSTYALLSLGHRERMSVNTLAFAAIVILVCSPSSLFDVGFQMSFMAVLSILVWMPLFDRAFPQEFLMSHPVVKWCWGLVSVSCAAQIGVAPLIAYYFGRFSTYFLLTNMVVVPLTTLILYLSLMVMAVPSLAYLLLYIVSWLNMFLTWMAGLPGASIENLQPSWLQVLMVYVIIGAVRMLLTYIPASGARR